MKLVVGLGNPGKEYAGTRHNIGFETVDFLAYRLGWTGGCDEFDRLARNRFDGLTMDGTVSLHSGGTDKLLLLKPLTYMNLSGRAVQQAMNFYQVTPVDVMVVLDDMALPCGRLRIRPGGSSGGHNGLKDIERALGTSQYPRLRIGIDAPPPRVPARDYVLGRYTSAQRDAVDAAITRGAAAIVTWIEKGTETAMNQYNAAENED